MPSLDRAHLSLAINYMTNNFLHKLTSGFILHSRPYRETSLLVDFFTQDFGRITSIVRGVRKSHSRTAGILSPFVSLCLSFRGKTELLNVQTLEAAGQFYFLHGGALLNGLYVNELLYRLLHRHDPYPKLFNFYQEILEHMSSEEKIANTHHQWLLRIFEKRLLQEIGYGVQLDRTVDGAYIEENLYYKFQYGIGLERILLNPCDEKANGITAFAKVDMPVYPIRDNKFKGSSLLALHNEQAYCDNETLKECGYILHNVLYNLLGDKFLRCQKIFAGMDPH